MMFTRPTCGEKEVPGFVLDIPRLLVNGVKILCDFDHGEILHCFFSQPAEQPLPSFPSPSSFLVTWTLGQ